uniref:Uncharacterized protein n=1 Tax=Latilactobacillus sakei TaxID=1599 RepID=A0A8F1L9Y4_LATSK|nr:hypothetical protein [Latilactobacillus sakei]QWP89814.1 hypothetical protein GLDMNBAO_00026 [Latilactobacillus sakei]UMW90436.1 hypothetical protein GLDMNBAO_00026 [Latilactobacillus sakei]
MLLKESNLRRNILEKIKTDPGQWEIEIPNVDKEEIINQINFLYREGYITKPTYGDNTIYSMAFVKITEKGEKLLEAASPKTKVSGILKYVGTYVLGILTPLIVAWLKKKFGL